MNNLNCDWSINEKVGVIEEAQRFPRKGTGNGGQVVARRTDIFELDLRFGIWLGANRPCKRSLRLALRDDDKFGILRNLNVEYWVYVFLRLRSFPHINCSLNVSGALMKIKHFAIISTFTFVVQMSSAQIAWNGTDNSPNSGSPLSGTPWSTYSNGGEVKAQI